jgi:hypothetical protein
MRGQGKLKEIVAMKEKFNWLMMHTAVQYLAKQEQEQEEQGCQDLALMFTLYSLQIDGQHWCFCQPPIKI